MLAVWDIDGFSPAAVLIEKGRGDDVFNPIHCNGILKLPEVGHPRPDRVNPLPLEFRLGGLKIPAHPVNITINEDRAMVEPSGLS